MPTPSKPVNHTIKLSQQALNVARQTINAIGWATTLTDIIVGGALLSETFPKPDATDWVKSDEDILKLSPKERAAYLKRDADWAAKEHTFSLTTEQKEIAAKAISHWATSALKNGQLAPASWLVELIKQFDIKTGEETKA